MSDAGEKPRTCGDLAPFHELVIRCDRKPGHKGMHREEHEGDDGISVMIHWGKRAAVPSSRPE